MRCAVIDIGSNTTRLLVAEPGEDQLRVLAQRRDFTRIGKGVDEGGRVRRSKLEEVCEVVATHVHLARELEAETIRAVATAAIRGAGNRAEVVEAISDAAGLPVEILSEEEEGRLAFLGATRTLGRSIEGSVGVVDVGGGSSEVVVGTMNGGIEWMRSFPIGSGSLSEKLTADPPTPAELAALRDRIAECFDGVEAPQPGQAVAVGGSASSLRRIVGAVLEHETLERAMRVLTEAKAAEVARRFDLDPERVRMLPAGLLLLERLSALLGQPLQIGNGGLREGVILDLLNGGRDSRPAPAT